MAAGLGFKDFVTGEVLTAADVDGYLMQGIWVFASAAARDAAVTAPAEGNFAFTKDTNGLWYYDGAAWVASGATGDIEGVTAGTGISGGGTSGTVTITNSMATAIDAKGDLIGGTGADTFARLAVGANDTVLTADSTTATGLKWAAAAAGGGMTSIASGSLSGASLDLTSISGSYKDLVLILRAATPANDTTVIGRLNNDSTGIYNYVSNRQSGGTYSTDSANTATSFPITSATGQNPQSGALVFTVFDYANTTAHKQVQLQYNFTQNTGAICNNFVAGTYRSTSAISRITLTPGSGNWSSGTYILYGVN
ncbi:hypothetical protein UFOVP789_28 [uncultured Caudovirales phage]|uniref:Bacteriophage lambda, Stf, side tail fibre-repeat-2 n=1 Tax=uncultured Caudovirales phage TaxID=2100421 RepID=A0A6J5P422_9CAUD|nr:hypothetical protein UFOVP789_28 [uncultured Caudovirales phage]